MAKKKKKKKGGIKPSYATGKKVEEKKSRSTRSVLSGESRGKAKVETKKETDSRKQEYQGWNLIRSGSIEMKVYKGILAIIIIASLLQYPFLKEYADRQYNKAKNEYLRELKSWQEKYKSEAEQKKHESSKPKKPLEPSSSVIIFEIALGALWLALLAFLALNISRRTDLKTPIFEIASSPEKPQWVAEFLLVSVPAGIVSSLPLAAGAYISASHNGGKEIFADYPLWKYSLYFINTGVLYTILFVFLGVSSFTWIFSRFHDRLRIEPHISGISAASIFALLLNLPGIIGGGGSSNSGIIPVMLSPLVVIWVFGLGYLYWKKGVEYAILAGAIGFALYPIFSAIVVK